VPACYVGPPPPSLRGDFGQVVVRFRRQCPRWLASCNCFPGPPRWSLTKTVISGTGAVFARLPHRSGCSGGNEQCRDGWGSHRRLSPSWGACTFVRAEMEVPGTPCGRREPGPGCFRELTDAEMAWKANGTGVYQELARRSRGQPSSGGSPLCCRGEPSPDFGTGEDAAVPAPGSNRRC